MLSIAAAMAAGAGCHPQKSGPELRVLGVQGDAQPSQDVVVVQLTNPANRSLHLTKLEYSFASAGGVKVFEGEMPLTQDVAAGEAIVVEIPFGLQEHADSEPSTALTLRGVLTAETGEIVKTFRVQAQVPHDPPPQE